jgi:BMFP domain-containing protein YqiC
MDPTSILKDVTDKILNSLPANLQTLKSDLEKSVHSILTNAFSKLDLVTRQEFDTQTKVLARTRKKIEALEIKITELEARLNTSPHE